MTKAARRYKTKRYRLWIQIGICPYCCQRQAMPGVIWCAVCSEAHAERQLRRAHRYIAERRCRRCGHDMDREGTLCRACCAKAVIYNRNARMRQKNRRGGEL